MPFKSDNGRVCHSANSDTQAHIISANIRTRPVYLWRRLFGDEKRTVGPKGVRHDDPSEERILTASLKYGAKR